MDISDTLAPNSDQMDAIDLVATGPRTFTIEKVTKGNPDQPINVKLVEFDRPWRPGKSMRRVLAAIWTPESSTWIGKRLTLWCDPEVTFGRDKTGGVRIKAMSHIDKPQSVLLLVTRGKTMQYTVQPLADEPKPTPSLRDRVLQRSREMEPDLSDDERNNWIRAELAELGGNSPEHLTALLSKWEAK